MFFAGFIFAHVPKFPFAYNLIVVSKDFGLGQANCNFAVFGNNEGEFVQIVASLEVSSRCRCAVGGIFTIA